jgi:hypothetical protein
MGIEPIPDPSLLRYFQLSILYIYA